MQRDLCVCLSSQTQSSRACLTAGAELLRNRAALNTSEHTEQTFKSTFCVKKSTSLTFGGQGI